MGLFDFLKKQETKKVSNLEFKEINTLVPIFTPFGKNFMNSEVFQSCVSTNGSYASKIKARSIRETFDGKIEDYPELDKLLQIEPNPTMNAPTFWERTMEYYSIYNNAFIWIEKDKYNGIKYLWSLNPSSVQFAKSRANGEWFLKFQLENDTIVVPYSDVIHISKNVLENDIWGDSNKALNVVLNLISTNYQGLENSIKTSGIIKFLGQTTTKLEPRELKKRAREFAENFMGLDTKNNVGVAFIDSLVNLTQLDTAKQKTASPLEQENLDLKIYNFMGVPERVSNGTATEQEVIAYIERTIQPFIEKLSAEMTRKIFTKREIGFKNRIEVLYNKFENMTMQTKLAVITTTRELGFIKLGWYADMLGIPERYIVAEMRNQAPISQNYQGGMNINPNEESLLNSIIQSDNAKGVEDGK